MLQAFLRLLAHPNGEAHTAIRPSDSAVTTAEPSQIDLNLPFKRQTPRFATPDVFVTLKARPPFRSHAIVRLLDLSSTGVSFQFFEPIKLGKRLRLFHKGKTVRCSVAWVKRDANSQLFSIGAIFSDGAERQTAFFHTFNGLGQEILDRRYPNSDSDIMNEAAKAPQRDTFRRLADAAEEFVLMPTQKLIYRRELRERRAASAADPGRRSEDRRAKAVKPPVEHNAFLKSITKTIFCFRDLLIFLLPGQVTRPFFKDMSFAFVTHPRDLNDIVRHFPFAKFLPKSVLAFWLRYQWPVIGAELMNIPSRGKAYQKGWLIFCPLTAKQMIRERRLACKRVETAVKFAEKVNARIVGLGAFTSIVTHDGLDLVGKVKTGITTGNALSAATAIQNAAKATELVHRKLSEVTVAIVGAAGNVGSACARVLSKSVKKLILVDINKRGTERLAVEIAGNPAEVHLSTEIGTIAEADIVIVVTNTPGVIVRAQHLKRGAIVIDCAQPKNVSEQVPLERSDVIVIESAVLRLPGLLCDFDLGIGKGEALGCMAETIVLDAVDWHRDFSVGRITVDHIHKIMAAAKISGADLAYFRHAKGYVSEQSFNFAKSVIDEQLL